MLHRRLVRDYEHRPASAESRVYWAISDVMARRLTGTSALARRDPQQTLGALLARLEVPERQIAVEAEAAHEQIVQLTALLDGLAQAAEHIAITRKTLLELTDEAPWHRRSRLRPCRTAPPTSRSWPCSPKPTPLACAQRVRGDGPEPRTEQHQQRPHQTEAFDQCSTPVARR